MAIFASITWGGVVATSGVLLRDVIGRIFTNDPTILEITSSLAPIIWPACGVLVVGDICLGVLQGCGRASEETWAYASGTWGVGVPLALAVSNFTHLGLYGLWGAMLVGYAVIALLAFVLVLKSNWGALTQDARERSMDREEESEIELQQNKKAPGGYGAIRAEG